MNDKLAAIVYPVLRAGLSLKDDVLRGVPGNALPEAKLRVRRDEIRGMLKTANEALRDPDYGGDGQVFNGARYALTVWLDEMFVKDVPVGSVCQEFWTRSLLETALYNMAEGGHAFWEQAEMAERLGHTDALEVYYLCVLLGFRGDRRGQADLVRQWRQEVEAQLNVSNKQWPEEPMSIVPGANEPPPLGARGRLQSAILRLLLAFAVLLAVVVAQLVHGFVRK
jgi:type VI secretion system protein ImpK